MKSLKPLVRTRSYTNESLRAFFDALSTSPLVMDAWDEHLWRLLMVKGTVGRDGSIEVEFSGGKFVQVPGRC